MVYLNLILQVVNDKEQKLLITPENLGEYVGKPVFSSDKMYDQTPVSGIFKNS